MVENPLDLWLCSFFTFFQINPLTYTKDSGCSSKIEFSFECNPFLPGTARRLTWLRLQRWFKRSMSLAVCW